MTSLPLCRIAVQITAAALRTGVRELAALSAYSKAGIETGGDEVVTSADLAASRRARAMARTMLSDFVYIDEEMAADPAEAAAVVRANALVAMSDPIDGSLAIAKAGGRLAFFGKYASPSDAVDQYSSTLTLWKDGSPFLSAVATARGHVLVCDGTRIMHSGLSFRGGGAVSGLRELDVPSLSSRAHLGKQVAFLGAMEHLPKAVLDEARKSYHCQRPGHFAADFVELLCGNARTMISGSEKIWDYSVAVPFISALPCLEMSDLARRAIRRPYPARTSVRIFRKAPGRAGRRAG